VEWKRGLKENKWGYLHKPSTFFKGFLVFVAHILDTM
jgi:hypothetical protein